MEIVRKPDGICYRKGWQHTFLESGQVEDSGTKLTVCMVIGLIAFALAPWLTVVVVVGSVVHLIWSIGREIREEEAQARRYEALGPKTRYFLDRGYTLRPYKG